jgi:hypothetical protein
MKDETSTEGRTMLKELAVDRLLSDRPWPTDVDDMMDSIRKDGVRVPILVTPQHVVIDGNRRLAAARKLGYTHIPCIVTSDYMRIVEALQAARDDINGRSPKMSRLAELYSQIRAFGNSWSNARRTIVPREGNLAWRKVFVEAMGRKEWELAEYLDAIRNGQQVAAKSPQHATAVAELLAAVDDGPMGPAGAKYMLTSLRDTSSVEAVESMMDRWRVRQLAKTNPGRAQMLRQQYKREKAKEGKSPREVPGVGSSLENVVSHLEGIALGLPYVPIPADVDPEARKRLLRRASAARRQITQFINVLKGSEL